MALISEYLAANLSPDASADALAIINNRWVGSVGVGPILIIRLTQSELKLKMA